MEHIFFSQNVTQEVFFLCKILTTVLWGTRSSFEAPGLRWKASRTASTVSSLTRGLPLLLRSPTLPVSTNTEYHALMLLTSGGGRPYSFPNFRWFCFAMPQNTLGVLPHWRHFDTSRLCNCNIKINTWHKILETKKKICLYSTSFLVINVCNQVKTLCSPCTSWLPFRRLIVKISFSLKIHGFKVLYHTIIIY